MWLSAVFYCVSLMFNKLCPDKDATSIAETSTVVILF